MAVGEVGHGAIRLGSVSLQREPAAEPEPEAVAAPEPEPEAPPAPEEPAAAAPPDPPPPPAATDAVPFRQGTIKLRKPSDD
jgi:hypothetical protein